MLVFHGRRMLFLNAEANDPLTEAEVRFVENAASR